LVSLEEEVVEVIPHFGTLSNYHHLPGLSSYTLLNCNNCKYCISFQ